MTSLWQSLRRSLGVEDCIYALRKFIARRGIPRLIYSDNAKTFLAAKEKIWLGLVLFLLTGSLSFHEPHGGEDGGNGQLGL